jgi:feruloyl esterase
MNLKQNKRYSVTGLVALPPLMVALLAACTGGPVAVGGGGRTVSCQAAAAAVAAGYPASGTTLRILKAEDVAATDKASASCLIEGALNERTSAVDGRPYAIKFRLRLPEPARWNGKFYMEGGGGANGILTQAVGMAPGTSTNAFERGYAVIATDSGHDNAVNSDPQAGGASAFGRDPQARIDFGYASYERVALVGKQLVAARYERAPAKSYFMGCSEGGREAMLVSQRFPTLFDGISAGAPAIGLPLMASYAPYLVKTLAPAAAAEGHRDAQGRALVTKLYTDADLQLAANAIVQACDALDGLADGMSNNLAACTDAVVVPKLTALTCRGAKTEQCLTANQIGALQKAYGGPRTSSGKQLYPAQPWDPGLGGMAGGKFNPDFRRWWFGTYDSPTNNAIKFTLSGPQHAMVWQTPPVLNLTIPQYFDYALTYDLDATEANITRTTALYTVSTSEYGMARSTELSKFRDRGSKLLVWIGNADAAVGVGETIDWYRQLNEREGGRAANFARLFTVPGMNHCSGGPATDRFDMLSTLEDWVERGKAPDRILATAGQPAYFGVASRTRPLCPYPQYARYKGSGDINDAANFDCH